MDGAEFQRAVREALLVHGDADRAVAARAYMKSAMPFRGVPLPVVRKLARPLIAQLDVADRDGWEDVVRTVWDEAQHREERYVVLTLVGHRRFAAWLRSEASLGMIRHLVVTGAWWDLVDEIASHHLGALVVAHPAVAATMRTWAVADDMWVRRAAILCQLGRKSDTDTHLLSDCIEPNLADREFFIRKAIGWALRQYAWAGPREAQWVREQVAGWGDRLAGLSRREALKHIGPLTE